MWKRHSLYIAWLLATVATLISLYQSEVMEILPCKLCTYNRIFLFPLPLILFPMVYQQKASFIPYFISLPLCGIATSIYQMYKESHCSSCLESRLSLPALITFILLTLLLIIAFMAEKGESKTKHTRKLDRRQSSR